LKHALVIHPRFFVYGGGELLSLYVMKALQDNGYRVQLVCDEFNPSEVERIYGMGKVMANCDHIPIPEFKPFIGRGLAFQRLFYARRIKDLLRNNESRIGFSTQSSIFDLPGKRLYHFMYDITDLFLYPPLVKRESDALKKRVFWKIYYWSMRRMKHWIVGPNPHVTRFFALSNEVLQELQKRGYDNSELVYPPCRLEFQPSEKKPRIVQVTRIVPQKRLEDFCKIAEKLPEYDFLLVGRDNPILRTLNPSYAEKLLATLPSNVKYVHSSLRENPQFLTESKVYLHTGTEPGIGIAFVEAIGAGCYPVAPNLGGSGEVLEAIHQGMRYESVSDAVRCVHKAMNSYTDTRLLRDSVKAFSPEAFMDRIQSLITVK